MKKKIITFYLIIISIFAKEGLWMPHLIKALNEKDMQDLCMQMSAEDIYSLQKDALNKKIVHFNGGCTGSVISATGLVLTNYHCGENFVQQHSSLEKNYLKNGFWAANYVEELPNPELYVTFIQEIQTVTDDVLEGTKNLLNNEKKLKINQNITKIIQKKDCLKKEPNHGYSCKILPFDYGNAYFLFVTQTFNDIRLVGTPPFSLGQFGLDSDNWEWPRHAADFALFRMYSDQNNQSKAYHIENKPYQTDQFLKISAAGVQENDFTLVYGFPGKTFQHLTAAQIHYLEQIALPIGIEMRQKTLEILAEYMEKNEKSNIQYIPKQRSIANVWKKSKGVLEGFKKTNLTKNKKIEEFSLIENIKKIDSPENNKIALDIQDLLKNIAELYHLQELRKAKEYLGHWMNSGADFLKWMQQIKQNNLSGKDWETQKVKIKQDANHFFKNFDPKIDEHLFQALTQILFQNLHLTMFHQAMQPFQEINLLSKSIYQSALTSPDGFEKLLNKSKNSKDFQAKIEKESFYNFQKTIYKIFENINKEIEQLNARENDWMTTWLAYKTQYQTKKSSYDANSTLRVAYGKVEKINKDGMQYNFYTTIDGLMEKYIPDHPEFNLPTKMIELYKRKEKFTPYSYPDGNLRLCFIASNQTTGGNSGSPVLNAKGQLIGLNFDRTYSSTLSDYIYIPEIMRNIAVDMRYILFIIDRFAGADYLIKELKIE